MANSTPRSVRFDDDVEVGNHTTIKPNKTLKHTNSIMISGSRSNKDRHDKPVTKSLKAKVLSQVFSEDYGNCDKLEKKILDPRGPVIQKWNKIFLIASLVSLFVDPLFFYLPETREVGCIDIGFRLKLALTVIRSLADVFYVLQIFIRFRTAFVAPSSRVFGRGELVIDPSKIALRYMSRGFLLDLIAALPLTQFLIWAVIPNLNGSTTINTKSVLRFSIILQYLPRLFLIFPLMSQIVKTTGVMTETAWAGAAYNLMLYMLVSHLVGAFWYLLSIERQEACWREACSQETPLCQYQFFDCQTIDYLRNQWLKSSNLTKFCNPNNNFYSFGIYYDAVINNVTSSPFLQKYFYCFWWGLKNLSCLGQNLATGMSVGENSFAIVVAILGLVLFGLLIGNMQSYLQSTTIRLEEWRIKRRDTEQWMRHRQLPPELKRLVQRYDQYKWVATRGVNEEALLRDLPMDLRRDIKRHLCLDLVRRVPLFDEMDDRMLDAICERLRPALYTPETCLVREFDPVNEMIFIIRGYLDSYTTNGGRTGFFNCCRIGPGDFCGEELLTWALDPRPAAALPSSTRTVTTVSEVEAFALVADDLRFVASQFRRLHSKQLRQKFRFYSHHWRTWAACFIQAAWLRKRRRRASIELAEEQKAGTALLVARMVSSKKKGTKKALDVGKSLKKPTEPDFSTEEDS